MKLSTQLYVIVSTILICEWFVQAENVIRYHFNNGEVESGMECTSDEMKMISAVFKALSTPSSLRKRIVELPERVLLSKSDSIRQIVFDGTELQFNGDEALFHMPSCEDKCKGYHPNQCFASNVKATKGNRLRGLQLAIGNLTKVLVGEVTNAIYPPNCKSKCAGQVDGNCMGVAGCQGYRRELAASKQKERGLALVNITATLASQSYPAYCQDRCRGFVAGRCLEPGCVGYRRQRQLAIEEKEGRSLQLAIGNLTKVLVGEVTNAIYPPNCKTKCAGQVDGNCMGVAGCQGYRRELVASKQEERDLALVNITATLASQSYPAYCQDRCRGFAAGRCLEPGCVGYRRQRQLAADPASWCVQGALEIDHQLLALLSQVSPQCYALIQAPRRKECYNDAAVCSAM